MLWRLINDGYLEPEKAETMKTGIIVSAGNLAMIPYTHPHQKISNMLLLANILG